MFEKTRRKKRKNTEFAARNLLCKNRSALGDEETLISSHGNIPPAAVCTVCCATFTQFRYVLSNALYSNTNRCICQEIFENLLFLFWFSGVCVKKKGGFGVFSSLHDRGRSFFGALGNGRFFCRSAVFIFQNIIAFSLSFCYNVFEHDCGLTAEEGVENVYRADRED